MHGNERYALILADGLARSRVEGSLESCDCCRDLLPLCVDGVLAECAFGGECHIQADDDFGNNCGSEHIFQGCDFNGGNFLPQQDPGCRIGRGELNREQEGQEYKQNSTHRKPSEKSNDSIFNPKGCSLATKYNPSANGVG